MPRRVHFALENFEEFHFVADGTKYHLTGICYLAKKWNLFANLEESVVRTPDGKKFWLTVVGDADEPSAFGIDHGWYTVQKLSENDADFLVKAFADFTKIHMP